MTHNNHGAAKWAALPIAIAAGIGAGAAAMYLFDPSRGRSRRAKLRDQAISTRHQAEDAISKAFRDTRNRATGLAAEARAAIRRDRDDGSISNQQLEARVRSRLGHVVSHPHAVNVLAQDGHIMLSGSVLSREKRALLSEIRHVPGVKAVDDFLDQHDSAEGVEALQGGGRSSADSATSTGYEEGHSLFASPQRWTPAMRFLAVLAGTGLALYGFRSTDPSARAATVTGLGLLARAMFNQSLTDLSQSVTENFRGVTEHVS